MEDRAGIVLTAELPPVVNLDPRLTGILIVYSTVLYSTVQYSTVLTVLYCINKYTCKTRI